MPPALPALLAVCLTLLASPFPWVDSGGLPPASPPPPAGAAAGTSTAVRAPLSPPALTVVPGPRLGPIPAVVGPEPGRAGLSSWTASPAVPPPVAAPDPPAAPAAPVPPPVASAVPVPVPIFPVPAVIVPPPATAPPAPPPAVAPGVEVDPAGGQWLLRRAADALAQISYPWQALGYEVAFLPGRSGVRARILRLEARIEVFARRSDSARQTAFDLAHEIGHAFDFQWGTWSARARWQQARGIDPAWAWFGCNGCPDLATPAGDFAESFAVWQVPGGPFASTLGPPPDEHQRALLAALTAA